MIKSSGVYSITNISNGHRYIGSSVHVEQRWRVHRMKLRNGGHHSRYLQRAWAKYGADSFNFEVLASCSREDCIRVEQSFIDLLTPEYNETRRAGSMLGFHHTEATKEKMRAAIRPPKVQRSAEHCANISSAKLGVKHGPMPLAHREAIRASHLGTRLSLETRGKISAAQKGQPSPKKGIPISAEQRAKIVATMSRPEVRARVSAAAFSRWARKREVV